ncbi:MAG: hypothetical protein JWQ48_3163, partial [Conexibacter sp.]|nr:hypothetical protein [Conexibacter sp.]
MPDSRAAPIELAEDRALSAPAEARHEPALLERAGQLAAIDALLAGTAAGRGGALLVEAGAGLGKTRLLRAAEARGGQVGMTVLTAVGGRFEQERPWGAAQALLLPALGVLTLADRRRLGAEWTATGAARSDADLVRVADAFFRAVQALAQRGPLLLCLDDGHWIDPASLRFVLYLLQRIDEVPIALVLAARPGEGTPAQPLLAHVAAHAAVRRIELPPLSPAASRELAAELTGAEDPGAVVGDVHALTAGNPFFLVSLLEAAAGELGGDRPLSPQRVKQLAAASLRSAVAIRLADRGPDAVAVARAVAVLGSEATVRRAALLARVAEPAAAVATDALVDADVLDPGEPLCFVHPLVAAAVYDALRPAAAADGHVRAARLLGDEGSGADVVGAHLLHAPRRADGWAVARLREAAAQASALGASRSALRFLQRALDEPPPPPDRAEVLVELARAQAATGDEAAGRTFAAALAAIDDPIRRAAVRRDEGRWLFTTGRTRAAARTYELARVDLAQVDPDHPLDQELRAAYLGVAQFDVDLRPLVERELRTLIEGDEAGSTPAERMLLAQLALQQTLAAVPRERVRQLCDRAWAAEALLADEGADGDAWTLVCGSLYWIGDLERELEILDATRAEAERSRSPLACATVAWCSAPALLHRGDVSGALAQAEAALDARRIGWARHLGSLHRVHARCLIERGELAAAEETLAVVMDDPILRHSSEFTILLEARGRLKLLRQDPNGALADFEAAGVRARRDSLAELPSAVPWRSSAAFARHALGDREAALELLAEELALAERAGVDRAISTTLRIRGLVEGGDEGLESLRAAVEALPGDRPRLERTYALVDLGAALRRAGRRRDAEQPLRQALAAAQSGGATLLAERARTELQALGARVRRTDVEDRDVLTASERRVALLAAEGRTNREIAGELYISPKTVEYHLSQSFRKLSVR